jgi:hypothetical protein
MPTPSTFYVRLAVVLLAPFATAAGASAQTLGTFRWQFAPYCNTVTVLVEQKPGVYTLTGTDDQCGAAATAAVSGTAHLNPNGTIGMGLTTVRPDGVAVSTTVTLALPGLTGPWRDDYGNGGTFQFAPAPAPAGVRRPVTLRGVYAVIFDAAAPSALGTTPLAFGRLWPVTPSIEPADIIGVGATPTARCPGTAAAPQAAPGVLCIYERTHVNIVTIGVRTDNNPVSAAEPFGAFLFARANAAGTVSAIGVWAMSLP